MLQAKQFMEKEVVITDHQQPKQNRLNVKISDLPPLSWVECRAEVRECTYKPRDKDESDLLSGLFWLAGVLLLSVEMA